MQSVSATVSAAVGASGEASVGAARATVGVSVCAISQCQRNQSVHALTDDALGCYWLAAGPRVGTFTGWLLGDSDELAGYAVRWLPVDDSLAMWLAGGLTTRWADWLARAHSSPISIEDLEHARPAAHASRQTAVRVGIGHDCSWHN